MKKPGNKPSDRLMALYLLGPLKSIEVNREDTDESFAEASERDGFLCHIWLNVVGINGSMKITEDELMHHFTWRPSSDSLWIMQRDAQEICRQWSKFLEAERHDLEIYERLKKKFE